MCVIAWLALHGRANQKVKERCEEGGGKAPSLRLPSETRWGSMADALSSLLEVCTCVCRYVCVGDGMGPTQPHYNASHSLFLTFVACNEAPQTRKKEWPCSPFSDTDNECFGVRCRVLFVPCSVRKGGPLLRSSPSPLRVKPQWRWWRRVGTRSSGTHWDWYAIHTPPPTSFSQLTHQFRGKKQGSQRLTEPS